MNTETDRASKPGDDLKCIFSGADGAADKVYEVQSQESTNPTTKKGEGKTETGADLLALWLRRRWSEPKIRSLLSERFFWHPLPTVTGSDFWTLIARLPLTKTPAFWKWLEVRAATSYYNREKLLLAKGRIFREAGWHPCPDTGVCSVTCDRCGGLGFIPGSRPAWNEKDSFVAWTGTVSTLIASPEGKGWRVTGTRYTGAHLGSLTGTLDQIEALLPWLAEDLRIDVAALVAELRRPVPPALPEGGTDAR